MKEEQRKRNVQQQLRQDGQTAVPSSLRNRSSRRVNSRSTLLYMCGRVSHSAAGSPIIALVIAPIIAPIIASDVSFEMAAPNVHIAARLHEGGVIAVLGEKIKSVEVNYDM